MQLARGTFAAQMFAPMTSVPAACLSVLCRELRWAMPIRAGPRSAVGGFGAHGFWGEGSPLHGWLSPPLLGCLTPNLWVCLAPGDQESPEEKGTGLQPLEGDQWSVPID